MDVTPVPGTVVAGDVVAVVDVDVEDGTDPFVREVVVVATALWEVVVVGGRRVVEGVTFRAARGTIAVVGVDPPPELFDVGSGSGRNRMYSASVARKMATMTSVEGLARKRFTSRTTRSVSSRRRHRARSTS